MSIQGASTAFLTGSRYYGNFVAGRIMNGIGRYIFPDGTEYYGLFLMGKFHGWGAILQAKPLRMIYRVYFEHGKLIEIESIKFEDGLKVDFEFDGVTLKYRELWSYCTPHDRRYRDELLNGIPPVMPDASVTAEKNPRQLKRYQIDYGDGIIHRSGFVIWQQSIIPKINYVGNKPLLRWMALNLRTNTPEYRYENIRQMKCAADMAKKIIRSNLKAANQVDQNDIIAAVTEAKNCHLNLCNQRVPLVETPSLDRISRLRSESDQIDD